MSYSTKFCNNRLTPKNPRILPRGHKNVKRFIVNNYPIAGGLGMAPFGSKAALTLLFHER